MILEHIQDEMATDDEQYTCQSSDQDDDNLMST